MNLFSLWNKAQWTQFLESINFPGLNSQIFNNFVKSICNKWYALNQYSLLININVEYIQTIVKAEIINLATLMYLDFGNRINFFAYVLEQTGVDTFTIQKFLEIFNTNNVEKNKENFNEQTSNSVVPLSSEVGNIEVNIAPTITGTTYSMTDSTNNQTENNTKTNVNSIEKNTLNQNIESMYKALELTIKSEEYVKNFYKSLHYLFSPFSIKSMRGNDF